MSEQTIADRIKVLTRQSLMSNKREAEVSTLVDQLKAETEAWSATVWALARELNCLPSTFSDGNGHVLKSAMKLNAELAEARKDVARLNALSRPGWELSMNTDEECGLGEIWLVHRRYGGRNDRQWDLIGNGASPRSAIDAALAKNGDTLE